MLDYGSYLLFLTVFTRMTGVFLFNPILGKRSVPAMVNIGLALCASIGIMPSLSGMAVNCSGMVEFILILCKEMLVGFVISFVIQMFLSAVLIAGEIIDLQLGLGMSRIYDPQSNVSMPLTGTVFNYMFILIFFGANGHLSLIKIACTSFQIVPPGDQLLSMEFAKALPLLFSDIFVLALKIAIPIIAIELLMETGMGILMRTVPQINVFVIGLQLKLFVGLVVVILLLPAVSSVLDRAVGSMFETMSQTIKAMT